jgi:hypothetical protein
VRFRVDQRIAGDPDAVARVFADPGYYAVLGQLPKLGTPQLLSHSEEGDVVRLRVRFRFEGELNRAARAALDPDRLTWVEESTHDLGRRHVEFRLSPDHYRDRLRCSGRYWFEPAGDGITFRHAEGEVHVRTPFVGRVVEQALVSGLREHLGAEVEVVERYLAESSR